MTCSFAGWIPKLRPIRKNPRAEEIVATKEQDGKPRAQDVVMLGKDMAFWGFAVHSFNASRAIVFLPVLGAERLAFASRLLWKDGKPLPVHAGAQNLEDLWRFEDSVLCCMKCASTQV